MKAIRLLLFVSLQLQRRTLPLPETTRNEHDNYYARIRELQITVDPGLGLEILLKCQ